jgi:hypothetical protein
MLAQCRQVRLYKCHHRPVPAHGVAFVQIPVSLACRVVAQAVAVKSLLTQVEWHALVPAHHLPLGRLQPAGPHKAVVVDRWVGSFRKVIAMGHNNEFRNQQIGRVGRKFVSFSIRCSVLDHRRTCRELSHLSDTLERPVYFTIKPARRRVPVRHGGCASLITRSRMYQCNPFSVTMSTSRPSKSWRYMSKPPISNKLRPSSRSMRKSMSLPEPA